jgi:hypothetical protein
MLTAIDNPYNIQVGAFAKKCTKCATSRHACVLVEQPLWDTLKNLKSARAAHARAQRDADDQEEMDQRQQRAVDLGQQLIDELKAFDHNRKNFAGDCSKPRKRRRGASHADTNEDLIDEVQSIRRGILALIEVGKVRVHSGASPTPDQLANHIRSSCALRPSPKRSSPLSTLP